jgi:hypothetical protein
LPLPRQGNKSSKLENDFQVDVEGISDEQIVHSAVGILRRDIKKLKIKGDLTGDCAFCDDFQI